MSEIEINEQFERAVTLFHAGRSLFITGKAGTGKSTLLRHIQSVSQRNMVVLAPTGIAALNVGGQTMHSFFNLPRRVIGPKELSFANPEKQAVMKAMQTMVIDEISMVRADVMDAIDYILKVVRKNPAPFGGVQVVMVGDLHQLPPVVTEDDKPVFHARYASPYAFNAKVFEGFDVEVISLTKIYRQADDRFIGVLNNIREGRCTQGDLTILNECVGKKEAEGRNYVYLTTTNDIARRINLGNLNRLPGRAHAYTASISGQFDEASYPADQTLVLKVGAQVIFVRNDQQKRWVNGTIGVVESMDEDRVRVRVGSDIFDVEEVRWDKTEYQAAGETIVTNTVGSFTQIPLKLAWAITIHKSQGQTFTDVIIDLGGGTFTHGQLYVALSRCRSLEGMILARPVKESDVIFDDRILAFAG